MLSHDQSDLLTARIPLMSSKTYATDCFTLLHRGWRRGLGTYLGHAPSFSTSMDVIPGAERLPRLRGQTAARRKHTW